MTKAQQAIERRFWPKVNKTNGCWLWRAGCDKDGYGKLRVGSRTDGSRRMARAHVLSWELHFGAVPRGKWVLHHCDTPACIRPDHLYLGGRTENAADVVARRRHPKRQQTHCKRGHEFSSANTKVAANGTRHCRACDNARRRKR